MKKRKPLKLEFPAPGSLKRYEELKKLADLAGRMQVRGWMVDRDAVRGHLERARGRQEYCRQLFEELTGIADLGKDGQKQDVKDFFWNDLKAPPVSFDKHSKEKKLDSSALVTYAQDEDYKDTDLPRAAALLYGYRKNGKAIGFCEEYLEASAEDGCIHPRWNVIGAKTGRASCREPNVQQLSGRSPTFKLDGKNEVTVVESMKNILVARPGHKLVGADYSALELYLQAYLMGAKKLIQWMVEGKDLHIENAKAVLLEFNLPADASKTTHKLEREVAKLFFGFAYGDGDDVEQVYKQMKGKMPSIRKPLVELWRKRYFDFHPEYPAWREQNRQMLRRQGFIELPLSQRRLYLAANGRGFNQAHNAGPQGTGADRVNMALLDLDARLRWNDGDGLLAMVHDSIIAECREGEEQRVAKDLVHCMTYPVTINGYEARFVAEPDCGQTWETMKELKMA